MCFSATASFTAGTALSAVGGLTLHKSRGKVELPLALVPLLLYFIVRFPVTARLYDRSIFYESPHFYILGVLVTYLLATCVTDLFSSHRCINVFGVLTFVLAVAAYQVSIKTFVSVWCFFAAVLSLLIYLHFSGPMQACRPALARAHERAAP